MCACSLEQVTKIVELMAENFNLLPSLVASPVMGFRRRFGACGIKIAVRFLTATNDRYHAVNILVETLAFVCCVRECLQQVTCTFYGLVWVGVVEGECPSLVRKLLCRVGKVPGGVCEVGIAPSLLTLAES